jgi:hypothetical protein
MEGKEESKSIYKLLYNDKKRHSTNIQNKKGYVAVGRYQEYIQNSKIYLDRDSIQQCELPPITIPEMPTVSFTHPQRSMIYCIESLEADNTFYTLIGGLECKVMTSAIILSYPAGSGKTMIILGCIARNPCLHDRGMIMKMPVDGNLTLQYGYKPAAYYTIKQKLKLRASLIIVAPQILDQFEAEIITYTKLKYFIISGKPKFDEFITMFKDFKNGIPTPLTEYDIILIKNSQMKNTTQMPDDEILLRCNQISQVYIFNLIANLSCQFSRVITDDFDIARASKIGLPVAQSTILISATHAIHARKRMKNDLSANLIRYPQVNYNDLVFNATLFTAVNFGAKQEFISQSVKLAPPKYIRYEHSQSSAEILSMNLLRDINDNNLQAVIERINAGEIKSAAEAAGFAGITCKNAFDVCKKIFESNFKQYQTAVRLVDHCDTILQLIEEKKLLSMSDNNDAEDKYFGINRIREEEVPEYKYPNMKNTVENFKLEQMKIKDNNTKFINRIQDNLREDACPICMEGLRDSIDSVIMPCCGAILCTDCFIKSRKLKPDCVKCRQISKLSDVIFLSSTFNTEALLVDETVLVENEEGATEDEKYNLKYNTMVKIILGEEVKGRECNVNYNGIILGEEKFDRSDIMHRKFLIFASNAGTVSKCIDRLTEENIKFWKLSGDFRKKAKYWRKFNSYKKSCCLVINSSDQCGGMHLVAATDIIFMHEVLDKNIFAQLVGRAQRLGKPEKTSVICHLLAYQNENF